MTHPASLRQHQAADPAHSVWLSANAGSGKTKVLTDRVARLLLAGTPPERILCLTYTKAAASEMQNRLFTTLGGWAMMPEAPLRAALADLGLDAALPDPVLQGARRLFARAIETPGGLKIQTIHSFCAALLRRFPLEAGVSPGFRELDERSAELLHDEIIEDLADRIAPGVMAALSVQHSDEDFRKLARTVASRREGFTPETRTGLAAAIGVGPGEKADTLVARVVDGVTGWLPDVLPFLDAGKVTNQRAAARLRALDFTAPDLGTLQALEGVFLTGADTKSPFSAKIDSLPTKEVRQALGPRVEPLHDLMLRVEEARPRRVALFALERAETLHDFAAHFLREYEARKARRGLLDFDDLIQRAGRLVSDPSVAQWVLYRLDGGIDHILVDEAQDTAPGQWQAIERLTQEITAGRGARDVARTIFVVGDKKQSIYSFQGADLEMFDRMQARFAEGLAALGTGLRSLPLEYSFRSSPAILRAVDTTCAALPALGPVSHLAFNSGLPGRVDIWPAVPAEPDPEPEDWSDPVDMPSPRAAAVVLAEAIAGHIRATLDAGTAIPTRKGPRAMHPGDVLILVQRRNIVFHEVIRACKAAGLPIAGADRLRMGAEIAVRDMTALLSFLATPEDDLSLAVALRSPLFGWTEAQVYDLARGRKGWLWKALRNRDDHGETRAVLQDLRDRVDFLRPFELIHRLLTRHGGRRLLTARLGAEAEDGIDQFLDQALGYERLEVPSLTGFLTWLQSGDVEVKRQADAAGGRIRVMTVHGAKGLEAPVVYLADTADRRAPTAEALLVLPCGTPVWRGAKPDRPPSLAEAAEQEEARWQEENARLLYVAMTRAESWLILAAAGKAEGDAAWHRLAGEGLEVAGALDIETPTGPGRRHSFGVWPDPMAAPPQDKSDPPPVLPDWAGMPPPDPVRAVRMLSPSDLGGAKALPGEAALPEAEALARGTALHLLLEALPGLPRPDWPAAAASLVGPDYAALLAEAAGVLDAPDLGWLFAPGTLAEVPVSAPWRDQELYGVIDRLVIGPDRVLAVDFKSNAVLPATPEAVPEGLLRQMGAYAHALGKVYPGLRVETAILWTATATLMPLPAPLTAAALDRATPLP